MTVEHLVRVGAMGQVGRFNSVAGRYPRLARVVVRTSRGLELGEVLAAPESQSTTLPSHGAIVRAITPTDALLAERLEKHRQSALEACATRLAAVDDAPVLLDVEHLFDGRTLVFYFLGPTSPQVDAITDELAETYEAQAQFRKFSELVTEGCGPGCGEGEGQCTSCSTGCAIAGACSSRRG